MKKTLIAGAVLASLTWMGSAVAGGGCPATPDAWGEVAAENGAALGITAPGLAGTACKLTASLTPDGNYNPGASSTWPKARVRDFSPDTERRYRARFLMDGANLVGAAGLVANTALRVFTAQVDTAPSPGLPIALGQNRGAIIQLKLQGNVAGDRAFIRGFVRDLDTNGGSAGALARQQFDLPTSGSLVDGVNCIEIDLDMDAGTFKAWLNSQADVDAPAVSLTDLDFADGATVYFGGVERATMGALEGTNNYNTVFSGVETSYDEFDSRRSTAIGCPAP